MFFPTLSLYLSVSERRARTHTLARARTHTHTHRMTGKISVLRIFIFTVLNIGKT